MLAHKNLELARLIRLRSSRFNPWKRLPAIWKEFCSFWKTLITRFPSVDEFARSPFWIRRRCWFCYLEILPQSHHTMEFGDISGWILRAIIIRYHSVTGISSGFPILHRAWFIKMRGFGQYKTHPFHVVHVWGALARDSELASCTDWLELILIPIRRIHAIFREFCSFLCKSFAFSCWVIFRIFWNLHCVTFWRNAYRCIMETCSKIALKSSVSTGFSTLPPTNQLAST